jgi:hypothetical protein
MEFKDFQPQKHGDNKYVFSDRKGHIQEPKHLQNKQGLRNLEKTVSIYFYNKSSCFHITDLHKCCK